MRTLIIYYSLTGNTQKVAEALASKFNADIKRIKDRRTRKGMFGTLRTVYQALCSRPGKIYYISADPAQYDLVIIGAPVWMMKLAAPLRTYILNEKHRFNKVAFFCTEGSSGGAGVFNTMENLCAKKPIATLEVTRAEIKSGEYKEKINNFGNMYTPAKTVHKGTVAA